MNLALEKPKRGDAVGLTAFRLPDAYSRAFSRRKNTTSFLLLGFSISQYTISLMHVKGNRDGYRTRTAP